MTTGVATFESIIRDERELVEAVVRAHRRGLTAIHEQPDEAIAVLADVLREPDDVARETFELLRTVSRPTGSSRPDCSPRRPRRARRELPPAQPVESRDLYDFSLLEPVSGVNLWSTSA